jgi:hypothetical protein
VTTPEPTDDLPTIEIVSVIYRVNGSERMEGGLTELAHALAANLPREVMLAALVADGTFRSETQFNPITGNFDTRLVTSYKAQP